MNDMNQTDQILEGLRPRMQAARVSHLRRMFAGVAIVPFLGVGAMAMTSAGDDGAEIETATAPVGDDAPEVTLPEIGAAGDGETNEPATVAETDEGSDDTDEVAETTTTTTAAPDPDAPVQLELGALGTLDVKPAGDVFEVLAYGFTDGWEVLSSETIDGVLVIIIGNGDVMKVITVEPGVRDEISVGVDDFSIPTTTTTVKPEPKPEPEPKPAPDPAPDPIVETFTVDVPGKGSFTVTRSGDTLTIGTVTPAAGYEYDIHAAQGWKVYVGFFNADHVSFGKALINDAGEVEQHFWDESFGPQPVYQWAPIDGVGKAKFEAVDGVIRVYTIENHGGYGYDVNGGASGTTAAVIFETEAGPAYRIDAWIKENGDIGWSTSEIT
ncbi:MAG: hypothetical protein AAGE98_08135 [Actinomycetota bacterium]